jgi:hypothetical protein
MIQEYLGKMDHFKNEAFLSMLHGKMSAAGSAYTDVIKSLNSDESMQGTAWLQQVVDRVSGRMLDLFPAIR